MPTGSRKEWSPPRVGGLALAVGLAYIAGALVAWRAFAVGTYPVLFPPAGVTVATALLTPRRYWPIIVATIALAEFGLDRWHGIGFLTMAGYALANVVEPVIGAALVLAWCGGPPDLHRRLDLGKFLAGAVIAGPLVGGAIGAAVISSGQVWWSADTLRWWSGDALGVLVFAPPILLCSQHWQSVRRRWLETTAVMVLAVGLQLIAFQHVVPPSMVMLPVLAWAAVRLGVVGVALTGSVMAGAMVLMSASGHVLFPGFGLSPVADGSALTQAYLAFMLLVAILIAQEVHSRRTAVTRGRTEQRRRIRVETLAALAQRLAADLTPADIGQTAAATVLETVGAQALTLGLVNQAGDRLEWVTMAGYPADAVTQFGGGLPLSVHTAATEVVNTGQPLILRDMTEYRHRYPTTTQWISMLGVSSLISWPLTTGRQTVGLLNLLWREPQPLDDAQVAYVSAVASMIGQALVRAQVYADENARAAVLQKAVLPTEPPEISGLDLAASYQPADAVHGLGGDWYDVVSLSTATYLAVGDVVGHGLSSVEDMAQLRTAARTLALQGLSPRRILLELNAFTKQLTNGRFATMVVAILEPCTGTLTYAYAGHPPVLMRRRNGHVVQLDDACGAALGVRADPTYPEGHITVDPGDVLVLYTDGLIESRGHGMDEGLERAQRIIASWPPDAALDRCCAELAQTLVPQSRHDDVCILAVRLQDAGVNGS